ncbi:cytochrome P450 CYP82D47-like protein [Tanacetum coccineum]
MRNLGRSKHGQLGKRNAEMGGNRHKEGRKRDTVVGIIEESGVHSNFTSWSFMHGGIRAWQLRMNFLGNKIFGTNGIKVFLYYLFITWISTRSTSQPIHRPNPLNDLDPHSPPYTVFVLTLDHKDVDVNGTDFELIPFGAGRRSCCPGTGLMLQMLHMVLATLLQKFELSTPNGAQVDMTESAGLTNDKATALEVLVAPHFLSLSVDSVVIDVGRRTRNLIGMILSSSPCLESLELKDCHGYKRINVTSKNVKKLALRREEEKAGGSKSKARLWRYRKNNSTQGSGISVFSSGNIAKKDQKTLSVSRDRKQRTGVPPRGIQLGVRKRSRYMVNYFEEVKNSEGGIGSSNYEGIKSVLKIDDLSQP